MAATTTTESLGSLHSLIDGLQQNHKAALDAVKRFVDTVNDTVPDVTDDGPRKQIIDAAFRMTEQIVDASSRLAKSVVDTTGNTVDGLLKSAS